MPVPVPESAVGFQPDAQFAVMAQQEEINRLRQEIADLSDRMIWQRAVNLQMQAEFNAQIAALQSQLRAAQSVQDTSPADPAVPDGSAPQEPTGGPDGVSAGPVVDSTVGTDPTAQLAAEQPILHDDHPGEHRRWS